MTECVWEKAIFVDLRQFRGPEMQMALAAANRRHRNPNQTTIGTP